MPGETSMPKSLTVLANNPDLIPGIYNYCDRWCERCPLTSRCLVYATESELTENDIQNNDIRNAAFWQTLSETLAEVRQFIPEWATQALDLNKPSTTRPTRRQSRQVDNHPLAKAGKQYANAASEWFRELDQTSEITTGSDDLDHHDPQPLEDAREVIQWYQYQIAVKTMRALSARNEDDSEDNDLPKDSDGSAKVALIGIDRSIAAWRLIQLSLSDRAESIVPLILQLETLRTNLEESFPQARDFMRPGFDEVGAA
jgi:hypothetical protein